MASLSPSIVQARVTHARTVPKRNSFTYGVDYLLLNEDQISGQDSRGTGLRFFSFGRRNLVSLFPQDHGFSGDGGALWVRQLAAEAGIGQIAEVALLTHPRYWGYSFNPVSFWFMTGSGGGLKAVLAEVHNTFGDRHCYLCRTEDGAEICADAWIATEKRFHVSPFFEIEGSYRFRFALDAGRVAVWIRYEDGKGGGLFTSMIGARQPLTDWALLRVLIRRPLGAVKTTALIHWQALKLFLKGVRYRARPKPASEWVS